MLRRTRSIERASCALLEAAKRKPPMMPAMKKTNGLQQTHGGKLSDKVVKKRCGVRTWSWSGHSCLLPNALGPDADVNHTCVRCNVIMLWV